MCSVNYKKNCIFYCQSYFPSYLLWSVRIYQLFLLTQYTIIWSMYVTWFYVTSTPKQEVNKPSISSPLALTYHVRSIAMHLSNWWNVFLRYKYLLRSGTWRVGTNSGGPWTMVHLFTVTRRPYKMSTVFSLCHWHNLQS